jgi:hypothetical protein
MLTTKMRELLCKADIDQGVLNDVPFDTVGALVSLGIIDEQWQHSGSGVIVRRATAAGPSTYLDRVKLTSAGIGLACSIQGVEKVVSSKGQNEMTTGHGLGSRRENK